MTSALFPAESPSATRPSEARERALIARVAAQDREAMRELYLIYHRRLARFLTRLTPRYDIVEEIINDTLVVVWQNAQRFRGDSRVSTWIIGIAYRRGLKSLRTEQRAGEALPPESPDDLLADNIRVANADARDWLDRALAGLPIDQRTVLELTYYLGYSCEEVASIMECPVNTVKTRMFHARQKLRVALPMLAAAPGEN